MQAIFNIIRFLRKLADSGQALLVHYPIATLRKTQTMTLGKRLIHVILKMAMVNLS